MPRGDRWRHSVKDLDETRDPVEELAEEFLERHRRGEHPSVQQYAEAHPAWAERIRELFPALLILELLCSGLVSRYRYPKAIPSFTLPESTIDNINR